MGGDALAKRVAKVTCQELSELREGHVVGDGASTATGKAFLRRVANDVGVLVYRLDVAPTAAFLARHLDGNRQLGRRVLPALHLPEQSTAQRSEGCSAIARRGLTLGGGIAWLMGKFGMAVDNLLPAEVVLASSEVVIASEGTDPDLF